MKISGLVKADKDKFTVHFEDGGHLVVTVNQVADYSLYAGRALSEDEYKRLRSDAADSAARKKALDLLGRRAYSHRELAERLEKTGAPAERAEETVGWLERVGAINDADYAAAVARHYVKLGFGERKIRDELYRRKVPREIWDDAIAAVETDEGKLNALVRMRFRGRTPDELDKAELRRVTEWLARRGFSWDSAREAVSRYINEYEEH